MSDFPIEHKEEFVQPCKVIKDWDCFSAHLYKAGIPRLQFTQSQQSLGDPNQRIAEVIDAVSNPTSLYSQYRKIDLQNDRNYRIIKTGTLLLVVQHDLGPVLMPGMRISGYSGTVYMGFAPFDCPFASVSTEGDNLVRVFLELDGQHWLTRSIRRLQNKYVAPIIYPSTLVFQAPLKYTNIK